MIAPLGVASDTPKQDGRSQDPSSARWRWRSSNLLLRPAPAVFFLVLVFAVARYLRVAGFGWYEDDLTILPQAVVMEPQTVLPFIADYIVTLSGHARPISNSLIYLLSNLGWRLGGLPGPYFLGFLVEAGNIALFYALIRRVWGARLAFFSGLAYVLFSADTTQAFLTHSLGAQPSITMLLLGLHAYVSRRWVLAYALAFVILFSYETPFPVFVAGPLMIPAARPTLVRRMVFHAMIMLAMLAFAYGVRAMVGEERVTDQPILALLMSSVSHMAIGPIVGLASYLYRPLQAVSSSSPGVFPIMALGVLGFFATLRLCSDPGVGNGGEGKEKQTYGSIVGVGLLLLVLAYALALTVRPYALSGRDTRVHLAAVVGAAMVVGGAIGFALSLARSRRWRPFAVLILSIWLATLLGFGLVIQDDYVRAWSLQQDFWGELVPQVQDASEATVIVVDPAGLVDTLQIGANTWNLPRIFEQLYELPPDWETPPRVYRGVEEWREYLILPDGSLRVNGDTTMSPEGTHTTTEWDHLVVIETKDGVQRRLRPLIIDAEPYPLPQPGEAILSSYPTTILFDLLVGSRPTTTDQ